jgi:hypothetical protein
MCYPPPAKRSLLVGKLSKTITCRPVGFRPGQSEETNLNAMTKLWQHQNLWMSILTHGEEIRTSLRDLSHQISLFSDSAINFIFVSRHIAMLYIIIYGCCCALQSTNFPFTGGVAVPYLRVSGDAVLISSTVSYLKVEGLSF